MFDRFPVVGICGARQVGKSTLLRARFGDRARTFVFDPITDVGNARQDPELFLGLHPAPLILDEVQFAPELLPVIKRRVDEAGGVPGQYLLTGSQQFNVLRRVEESLAGRIWLADLWPMSQSEIRGVPDRGLLPALLATKGADARSLALGLGAEAATPRGGLLEVLYRGGYPGLLDFEVRDVGAGFEAYVRTYVERDVRTLRAIDDLHDFSRFMRLIAALTATELNASHLGRKVGISPKTARAWLDALTYSYQVLRLDAYAGNTIKRISGRPKIHMTDVGLACSLLAISSPEAVASHPLVGALFETFAVMEIAKQALGLDGRPRLWHWRSSGGAEVDLVIERDGVFYPIEIKWKSRPSGRDLSGIRQFRETYPHLELGTGVVVHGGVELLLLGESTLAVPAHMV